jgi:surfeit locus 1 family protein
VSPPPVKRGGLIEPTVFTVVGVVFLIGLGLWQLDRKTWKENLIATVTARINGAPQDLPPRSDWPRLVQENSEYTRVAFPAELLEGQEALVYTAGSPFRPDVAGAGYWAFAPAQLAGGSIVMVNRGFVPLDRKDPTTRAGGNGRGIVDIVGVMRWPESRGPFTPADDPKTNVWYLRDPQAMAAAKKWATSAPFFIDQEAPAPPGGWPKPGKLSVELPNNHLQYAITWFGLALALAGVYVVWLTGRIRRRFSI